MGRVRLLDEAMNEKSYLRLSLPDWYVHHMGNTLDENNPKVTKARARGRRLIHWGPLRKVLHWLYQRLFTILYRD